MAIKAVTYHRRYGGAVSARAPVTCRFWMEGRCNRNPCKFLHGERNQHDVYCRDSKQLHRLIVKQPRKATDNGPKSSLVLAGRLGGVIDGKVFKKPAKNQSSMRFVKRSSGSLLAADVCGMAKEKRCQALSDYETFVAKRPRRLSENENSSLSASSDDSEDKPRAMPDVSCLRNIRQCVQEAESSPLATDAPLVGTLDSSEEKLIQKSSEKACEHWMSDNCLDGDSCKLLHAWHQGDGFSLLAKLGGHNEVVTGIGLSSGSHKLFSGSYDGTVQVWDCQSAQTLSVVNLGDRIGTLVCEGPWVFVGIRNAVKVWNTETAAEFCLNGPVGQVYSIIVALDMLFAGSEDGAIVVWKGSVDKANPFEVAASLKGHTADVTCLAVGDMKLYSGSLDCTIRIWALDNLQCMRILNGHAEAVTSLIFCNQFLLSCSLDKTIKVWATTVGGDVEATHTHVDGHGVIALCGVNDAEGKPILLCSCDDNSVHLYELPSFTNRGRIFSKREVKTLLAGPGGHFFTGDGTGVLSVWKMQ